MTSIATLNGSRKIRFIIRILLLRRRADTFARKAEGATLKWVGNQAVAER